MQAPTLKHSALNQLGLLALVLGLAASLALNVAQFVGSDGPALSPAPAHLTSIGTSQGLHLEARMDQVDAGRVTAERATRLATWGAFLEARNDRIDGGTTAANATSAYNAALRKLAESKENQMLGPSSAP